MTNKSSQQEAQYQFTTAGPEDNADILLLLRNSPIRMEMDYIMDRQNDFFRLHQWLPASKVLLARDAATGALQGFLSLLKLQGQLDGQLISFQYVTDLIKSAENRNPFLMKRLLNYGFQHYFDTPIIFGLINARNSPARLFSTSAQLAYPGTQVHTFSYLEMAPLWSQRLPRQYSVRTAENEEDLTQAINLLNQYYCNHALYLPLTLENLNHQFEVLPGFSRKDVYLLYEEGQLLGAMITYRPAALSSLVIARMDSWSKLLFSGIRWLHRKTGWLFDPPREGGHINTLQVRHLAGNELARKALLKVANNTAYSEKLHSVSMLLDEQDPLKPSNWVTYRYQSLMYANGQGDCQEMLDTLQKGMIFFDIVYG